MKILLTATLVAISMNSIADTELLWVKSSGEEVKVATFHEFDLAFSSEANCNTLIQSAKRSKQLPSGLEFVCRRA